jgi:uncharacterized protein (DUF302 family)
MIETRTSTRTVDAVGAALEESAPEFGLSVLNHHDLAARMTEKGFPFETPVRVYDVCSAQHASQVLKTRIEIATAMPCRIAVYEKDGRTLCSTLKPSELLGMFGEPSLQPIAEEVERRIVELMTHAAG